MGRVVRGLQMLRLGKRDSVSTSEDPGDIDDILSLLQAYQEQNPEFAFNEEERELSGDELEVPEHHRFRRSTENSGVAPQEVQQSQSFKDSGEHELKLEEAEPYLYFPDGDFYYGDVDELLEGDNEDGSADKRQIPMLRLGKRSMSMLRLGKREEDDADFDEEKRSLSMLRLGKREDDNFEDSFDEENDKRSLSMLRLGKRPMSMLRLGKRPMSMLRLGKRPMSMLRLGKRPMSMLRLGKRPMSMLRLGKRPMSMLRLGKRPMSMLRLGKRPMSMLRLGKRPMSMLRLGKREDDEEKRSLAMS
ncbi:unnamed protein product [Lymnaea stagnalis]